MRRLAIIFLAPLLVLGCSDFDQELSDEQLLEALQEADDFQTHYAMFWVASKELLERGVCAPDDFQKWKTWERDHDHGEPDLYYKLCGQKGENDVRIYYLRVSDGVLSSVEPPPKILVSDEEIKQIAAKLPVAP